MNRELGEALALALGRLLLRRNRNALYDAILEGAPAAVDRQTYPVLSGLARLGPVTAAALADEIGVDRSGASRYADRLEAAGLIARGPDPHDRRATLLTLTPAGTDAVRALRTALADHLADTMADWPDDRVQAVIEGINLIADSR